ncbi:YcaO-like family protein [Streptomyces sp. M10(2022)]
MVSRRWTHGSAGCTRTPSTGPTPGRAVRPGPGDPWVHGYSLRDERPVLVPEVLTYYHAPGLENRFVQESSNGCASGAVWRRPSTSG